MQCRYCLREREIDHRCNVTYTVARRELRSNPVQYVDTIISDIKYGQTYYGWKPETAQDMRDRHKRQEYIATAIKTNGGQVVQEWQ